MHTCNVKREKITHISLDGPRVFSLRANHLVGFEKEFADIIERLRRSNCI